MALVFHEDCMYFCVQGQVAQSEGVRMLMYALILGNLHLGEKALLVDASVPNLCTIHQYWDHQCIIHALLV